jgi:uncharacterized damage-inducible protein DinB
MFTGTYPLLMAEYNRFMNQRLYAACADLPDSQRKSDRGAFFKSLHGTLDHILWGDRNWLARFDGKTYPVGPVGEFLYPEFAELRAAREQMDRTLLDWAASITPAWLDEPMTWTSKLYKFTQTHPRWVQVVQMFNHQTHHRGQAHTLLTQLGIDVGPTDVPWTPVLLPEPVREPA